MTTTHLQGRAPRPPMMHSDKVYASEAEMRAEAAERRQKLMGGSKPVRRLVPKSWSYAPAPLPVIPPWWAVSQQGLMHTLGDGDLTHDLPGESAWRRIVSEVCRKHDVTYLELCNHRRNPRLVNARHEASWRLYKETTLSTPHIGQKLGGRDHTTILSSLKRYEKLMTAETS